jgi:hypothetical protein
MRNISVSFAALALVLAGSLTSVADAANLERDHHEQRADLYAGKTVPAQAQATTNAKTADAAAGVYDNADKFRDASGHPLPGWQIVAFGTANG